MPYSREHKRVNRQWWIDETVADRLTKLVDHRDRSYFVAQAIDNALREKDGERFVVSDEIAEELISFANTRGFDINLDKIVSAWMESWNQ